jgi:hypothetical protein
MAVPEYLQDFVTDFAQQAKTSFGTPLDPKTFMGPQFVAGLDPLQTQAIGLAQAGIGSFAPFLTAAQTALGTQAGLAGAGAGTGPGSIAAFQSPFQQQVIDETLRQFDLERGTGRQAIQDSAVALGGFGGGREGAMLGQFDADTLAANQGAIAAGQLGLSNFMRTGVGQDISALGSLGALRQGLDQARLTATQQAEQASALEPYGRLDRFGTALTGLSGGVAAPSAPIQTPNPFGTALSNALGIGNLFANIYGAIRPT